MNTNIEKPNIEEYDNYRNYLKDLFEALKKTDSRFSYRYFSSKAGYRSPNFLKLVITGERNISEASIDRFADAFKLNREERHYFRNLVMLNQADNLEQQDYYANQLIKSKMFKRTHPLSELQYQYYAHWYYIPIREMVSLEDFDESPQWIANRLKPSISAKESAAALKHLEKLNLIKRDTNGKLVATEVHVTTGDQVAASSIPQFHKAMLKKAIQSMDTFKGDERDISSITAGYSVDKIPELKKLISQFRKDLLALSDNSEKNAEIYQINFQLFPLSENKKGPQS